MAAHEAGEIERDPGDDAMLDLLELEADGAGYHGGIVQLADKPQCACRWFRAWQLPCSHIWLHHFCYDSPQPIHFLQSFDLWSNSGFEIYEEISRPFVRYWTISLACLEKCS
jgi:hypothetical protein